MIQGPSSFVQRTITAALGLLVLASAAVAVQPGRWVHSTEADFETGQTDGTVVTNLGDIKLASGTTVIGQMPEKANVIYDMQVIGQTTYLAAGPQAKLLKKQDDQITEVLSLENEQIFALDQYQGQLLLAISGTHSRLALYDGKELTTLVELQQVRYIWDMLVEEYAQEYAVVIATGIEGQVLRIKPDLFVAPPADDEAEEDEDDDGDDDDGDGDDEEDIEPNPGLEVLLDTEQTNILCLARSEDGKTIYAGTDTDGLIYRITAPGSSAFVIYDAAEPEIGALLVTADGVVYAGTADADQARPGRLDEAQAEETGRPDDEETDAADSQEAQGDADSQVAQTQPAPESSSEQMPENTPEPDADADENDATTPTQPAQQTPAQPAQPVEQSIVPQAQEPEVTIDQEPEEAEPTPKQRDRLRELVRSRLAAARRSGTLQAPAGSKVDSKKESAASTGRTKPTPPSDTPKEGNAVYRIDTDGFVSEVFRDSVMILKLVAQDRDGHLSLLVATGNEGQVFRVDPEAGQTTIIADLEAQQIPAILLAGADSQSLLLGTANPAQLVELTEHIATRGTFLSTVLDAKQVSLWGTLRLTADIPADASVAIETRSGNVFDPELAAWSPWSTAQMFMPGPGRSPLVPIEMTVSSPPARFLQYRLTLAAATGGTPGNHSPTGATPVIGRVEAAYVMPNFRPTIAALKAAYPEPEPAQPGQEAAAPSTIMNLEFEAADPNADRLQYTLEYQPSGSKRWLEIADKVEQPSYEWETRRVPDGWYLVRVKASDRLDNPPDMAMSSSRRSDPVLIDNTAPLLVNLSHSVASGSVTIEAQASDPYSPIGSIAYALDSVDSYQAILPEDLIYDSTSEKWSITIPGLSPGPHVVTIRVTDLRGNTAYKAQLIKVD